MPNENPVIFRSGSKYDYHHGINLKELKQLI